MFLYNQSDSCIDTCPQWGIQGVGGRDGGDILLGSLKS